MKLPRRSFLRLATGLVAASTWTRRALALDYPTKPVRWIVGFPPGSAADNVVRIMARWLSDRFGQTFVVENKPGAATNISVQTAAKAAPDGYTLVYLSTSTAINMSLYDVLPFDFSRDIAPVAGLVNFPFVMLVRPSLPTTTVSEFIAYAKANPGEVKMASFGTGTSSHLAGELFKKMAEVDLVHVPYRASAPAHLEMMAGRVDVMFDNLTSPLPHIRSGALRALATAGNARCEELPDIPTIGETLKGYDVAVWSGLGVPKGTPTEIIQRLNRGINVGLADPAVRAQLAQLATTPIFLTPDAFSALITAETEKWGKVVRTANIKPE